MSSLSFLSRNFFVVFALTRRNMAVLRSHVMDFIINGTILAGFEALLYGYFLPAMGMTRDLIFPLFVGSIMVKFVYIGFEKTFRDASDLHSNRYLDYQFMLPLSKTLLALSFIIAYMIELTIQAFFPFVFGALLISSMVNLGNLSIFWLLMVHVMAVFYCALFFLTITFGVSFTWMLDNIWARFLVPLMLFGSLFYPWKNVNAISPFWGNVFLCNPFTYICEGYRGAFLGESYALHPGLCVGVLFLLSLIQIVLLARAFRIGMDPV